jgi:hypothetical protein
VLALLVEAPGTRLPARDEEGGMKSNDSREHPALSHARRMLKADKRPPTEADRPRRPSKPVRVLDGQIDIYGHVHGGHVQPELDRADDETIEPAA